MKATLICLCLVFVLSSCGKTEHSAFVPESCSVVQSGAPTVELTSCVLEEADGFTLVLPESGRTLEVRDEFDVYMTQVNNVLVVEADKGLPKACHLYLEVDEEGYLCLCGEQIVSIEPPEITEVTEDSVIDSGCGVDHKHVFYRFRITHKK